MSLSASQTLIRCSTSTGHVVHLDLSTPIDFYTMSRTWIMPKWRNSELLSSPRIGSSLAELKHLVYLDLSGNNFNQSQIPEFLKSFKYLTYLNISLAGFGGNITHQFRNLTNLKVLDLSYNFGINTENFRWASSLSSLQILDMSSVTLSKALDLIPTLAKLPSLLELQLNYCYIQNIHFAVGSVNATFLAKVQALGLGNNELSGEIPDVIRNMTALRYLNLGVMSGAVHVGFEAENMQWMSSLSSLQHLDMARANLTKAYDLFQTLNNLPSLLHLNLDGCGIQTIHVSTPNSTLFSRLQYLNLRDNDISGEVPDALKNMTELRELDLSLNRFNATVPLRLVASTSLVSLEIAPNNFDNIEGGLSSILNNACSLKVLRLSSNPFGNSVFGNNTSNLSSCISYSLEVLEVRNTTATGNIPKWLGKLTSMTYLNLGYNFLSGPIPPSIGGLPRLISLDLSNNLFRETIPEFLGSNFPYLKKVDLSHNRLNGSIPDSFRKLLNLEYLAVSYNDLNGPALDNIMQLTNLSFLDISSNHFEGFIFEFHFANLPKLKFLSISSTNLTWKVKPNWIPPFSLISLNMSSCKIGPEFPQWLETQKYIQMIYLSNANISGSFLQWSPFPVLQTLDLSRNQITGESLARIFEAAPIATVLLLDNNLISDSIPNSLCELENLMALDVSRNLISGGIPNCIRGLQNLVIINLSFNRITGKIPDSLGKHTLLEKFLVSQNSLEGELPLAMKNCTNLILLDLGENNFSGSIPSWIGESLSSLQILRLRKNMLSNRIPPQLCQLGDLQILDLAENKLVGEIPSCLGDLRGMRSTSSSPSYPTSYLSETEWKMVKVSASTKGLNDLEFTKIQLQVLDLLDLSSNNLAGGIPEELCFLKGLRGLNLSRNSLSGRIPKKVGDLKLLDTLDLSHNNLIGEIPPSMSFLPFISHLNFSHNNLSGEIPSGNQLQTLNDPSIYVGNIRLCGYPLPTKCPVAVGDFDRRNKDDDHEDGRREKIWFWFIVIAGYATGFWAVIGTFVFKKKWRIAYFRFVGVANEKVHLIVAVKVAMLKKMMNNSSDE